MEAAMTFRPYAENARWRLEVFAERLRGREGVDTVQMEFECKVIDQPLDLTPPDCPTRSTLEAYVEVELKSGEALSWRLEVFCVEDGWYADSDVTYYVRDRRIEHEYPAEIPFRSASTLRELAGIIEEMLSEMIAWEELPQIRDRLDGAG